MEQRIQKILAQSGVASRRRAEVLIKEGRVQINGRVVSELGAKADAERDQILLDGQLLPKRGSRRVLMLHKPVGFLSSCRAGREQGRLITELIPSDRRYFPIGRLDRDTSGLLLLTDDGDFAFQMAHPRHGVPKVYVVETALPLCDRDIRKLQQGIIFDDGVMRIESVEVISARRYRMVLKQGRKRQIRRMIKSVNNFVVSLHRSHIGNLCLGELPAGGWRELSTSEIDNLLNCASSFSEKRSGYVSR